MKYNYRECLVAAPWQPVRLPSEDCPNTRQGLFREGQCQGRSEHPTQSAPIANATTLPHTERVATLKSAYPVFQRQVMKTPLMNPTENL